MSDTVTLKRIIDLVTQADIDSGVYTIIDSVSGAVKKYPLGSLICSIAPIFDATEDYAAGAYCNYNGQLYRFTEAHAAGEWTGSDAEAVTVTDVMATSAELAGKADVDGTYPYLTAGSAQQLESDQVITDQRPYLFRRTGADATREFDCLVGGSVVSNQLANPIASVAPVGGIEFTASDGLWSITGTATGRVQTSNIFDRFNTITGHKYYISLSKSIAPFALRENNGSVNSAQTSIIANCPEGKNSYFTFDSGIDITGTVVNITDVAICIYDLTQMFGSTIADHAYTLEQATAGAGIAWMKSYGFFAGYQAYNAGSMVHVSGVSEHVMTGFNQWNEEWELGGYNASGEKTTLNSVIRSKNRIPVLPNTAYYFRVPSDATYTVRFVFYDADGACIYSESSQGVNSLFTTPANAAYFAFNLASGYGTTYNHDICVNLSNPAKNGTYEPYTVNSYTLDDTVTLRGPLKLVDGEIVYDGDTYTSDGTVTRLWGIRAYQEGDANSDTMLTDGTNTIYKLQTPTTESASPYQSPQICDPDGTEQYVTDGIPVGHETQYPANLRGAIERVMVQVPKAPSANGTYTLKCVVSGGVASYAWET